MFANSGSIRDNHDFEDELGGKQQTKRMTPGPGEYLTERSSFSYMPKPLNYQFFGSNVERFRGGSIGTDLGPGQYKPNLKRAKDLVASGTS